MEPVENGIKVGDHEITLVSDRNPENLPWKSMNIDIVIEATGKFNHGDKADAHIKAFMRLNDKKNVNSYLMNLCHRN